MCARMVVGRNRAGSPGLPFAVARRGSSTTFWWRRARSSGSVAAAVGKGVQATTKDAAVTASNKRLVVIGMHPTDRHQST